MSNASKEMSRNRALLLRIHERFGERGALVRIGPDGEARLVSPTGGTAMRVDADVLTEVVAAGLVVARKDRVMIAPDGIKLLGDARTDVASGDKSVREMEPSLFQLKPMINLAESPLSWLATRKSVDGKPYLAPYETEAGERLRHDFTLARLERRICMSWSPTGGRPSGRGAANSAADISDFALDARARLDKALTSLEPNLRGIALDVCCFLKGLEEVEKDRRWPRRSAKLVLKIALSQLASHYRLLPLQYSKGIRHWGDAGYRPEI